MDKNTEILRILDEYAQQIARIEHAGDIHTRYSNDSQDDISAGIRNYYDLVSRVLQST